VGSSGERSSQVFSPPYMREVAKFSSISQALSSALNGVVGHPLTRPPYGSFIVDMYNLRMAVGGGFNSWGKHLTSLLNLSLKSLMSCPVFFLQCGVDYTKIGSLPFSRIFW
jgi:hypothetical protein